MRTLDGSTVFVSFYDPLGQYTCAPGCHWQFQEVIGKLAAFQERGWI